MWGHIPPILRSVSIENKGDTIYFRYFFDKGFSDDDRELLSMAATEIIADFPSYKIVEECIVAEYPKKMNHLKNVLFFRHEHDYYRD